MKTLKAKLSVIVLLAIGAGSAVAQEYDDMYFSAKDRKQVKYVSDDKAVTQDLNQVSQVSQNPAESFSSKTVNPEYIAKYQAASQQEATAEFADDEYFVEDYNDNNLNQVTNDFQNSSQVAVRDRYGNISYFRDYSDVYWSDPFLYEGTVFDPFYRPYYSRFGYGNRWNRPWRSGWSVSVGWGWNSWGYNPWNTGWSYNAGWGWNYGWGWNSWNNGWCPPYYGYNGWGNNVVVINNYENRSNRVYRSGRASSRSGIVNSNSRRRSIASSNSRVDNDRSSTNGRSEVSSTSRSRYISESNSRRDYDDAQSKYYRRSRSSVSSGDDNRSYTSRSRSTSNYTPNSRSNYSSRSSTINRSSAPSNNRSYNSRSYNNSRSSGSSYSRPSNSRSNGYSPSRSSGNSRSSGYNRSSGSSSRSSGVSRSSSSSRSSGSRSSGSSRSSNRRGGN
ncbi:MAG: hypothetical protein ABJH05_04090 [Fulvivirga sp.]